MPAAPFMTRKLVKEFIEKNGRTPTKNEFIAIQYEAMNTVLRNNSVYGICENGGNKMTENAFGECEHPDTAASRILPDSIKVRCDFKYMTKEMYENFVKQGKKFVTLIGGQEFDSLEEAGIDLDGDIIIVDGQKYGVNMEAWYLRG